MRTSAALGLLLLLCHVSAEPQADALKARAASLVGDIMTFLQTQMQEQGTKLQDEIDGLKKHNSDNQVAFSASLVTTGENTFGPYGEHTTLVFKNVKTNIGNAYNHETGVFTAPVKGAYQFLWFIGAHGSDDDTGVILVKNAEITFMAHERQADGYASSSQGISLLLEAGDTVLLQVFKGDRVFDSHHHLTSFSGNLLFPM